MKAMASGPTFWREAWRGSWSHLPRPASGQTNAPVGAMTCRVAQSFQRVFAGQRAASLTSPILRCSIS
jgi:hypothetical protein